MILLCGMLLSLGAALSDAYLHRGIEASDSPPIVLQVSGRGLATNIDLRIYPQEQLESIAAKLNSTGFAYVRQPISWREVEPVNGSFDWSRYDPIVEQLNTHGVGIVAVLADSPEWARAAPGNSDIDSPPAEVAAYANFAREFVQHFQDKVLAVQVWDAPNDPSHWGGVAATPSEYSALLAETFAVLQTIDPDVQVVLGEFAPNYPNGETGADLRFLSDIYDSGAGDYFHVVAARIDGGEASPYDRSANYGRRNFSRATLFREVMIEEGDDTKPLWLTHYGWDGEGSISRADQADFMNAAVTRARAEWPWLGTMFAWAMQPDTTNPEEVARALLYPDGTSTPAYNVLAARGAELLEVASTGFVPVDASAFQFSGNWSDQHLNNQVFRTTSEVGARFSIAFEGTGISTYLRRSPDAGLIGATLDGEPLPGWPVSGDHAEIDLQFFQAEDIEVPLASDLEDNTHVLELELLQPGQLTIGGGIISRQPPVLWPVVVLLLAGVALAFIGIRILIYFVAVKYGVLRSDQDESMQPVLPRMPDWRPSPRA